MAAPHDLVTVVATFEPRLVKMAPAGERPEDWSDRLQASGLGLRARSAARVARPET
jgi:hypothetical protein